MRSWLRKNLRHCGVCMTHMSLLVIITAGIISGLTAERGYLILGENDGYASTWRRSDGKVMELPFKIRLSEITGGEMQATTLQIPGRGNAATTVAKGFGHKGYQFTNRHISAGGAIYGVVYDPYGWQIIKAGYALLIAGLATTVLAQASTITRHTATDARMWQYTCMAFIGMITVTSAMMTSNPTHQILPVLRHGLLWVHVSLIIASYAILLALSAAAAWCLCRHKTIKVKCFNVNLETGLLLLASGIASGSIWAHDTWGCYWNWDPKETWALLTFMAYAVPLHIGVLKPKDYSALYCIILMAAAVALLITWIGVGFFTYSTHSYIRVV